MERSQAVERLTPREQEVLELLRTGLTDAEIAARLGVSRSAASHHVGEIIAKLGVRNRHEAAYYPERPPWWLALMPPFLRPRAGPVAAVAAVAALAVVLAALGFVAFLLARGGDGDGGSDAVVDGTLVVPHDAIELESYAFTSHLDLFSGQGDAIVDFEGVLESPERIQGTLTYEGTLRYFTQPSGSELIAVGSDTWWREPGGGWQHGAADPFVGYTIYGTPRFYLQSLTFDSLDLETSGPAEDVNGVRALPFRFDKAALLAALDQGRFGLDGDVNDPATAHEDAAQTLPEDVVIEAWLAEDGLWPVRLIVTLTSDSEDFFFLPPVALRLEINLSDPNGGQTIEPPTP